MRVLLLAATCAACTTLGPMPATTGTTPIPLERTGVELQVAAVPGYYVSSAVKDDPDASPIGQAAALLDLAGIVPGVIVGGRYVGKANEGGYPEPLLGYRRALGQIHQYAVAVVAFGTRADGANDGATYQATRLGVEGAFDARATGMSSLLELHLIGAVSWTALWAKGRYCLDEDGRFGVDCPDPPDPPGPMTSAKGSGFYPAATLSVAADVARHLDRYLHGIRLALSLAVGAMPRVESGVQESAVPYATFGLSLTVGLGAAK